MNDLTNATYLPGKIFASSRLFLSKIQKAKYKSTTKSNVKQSTVSNSALNVIINIHLPEKPMVLFALFAS
jgi:hypothetical protein